MMFMLDGRPVSGSLSISTPSFTLKRPSGLVTYLRFAAGRGRRNTETVGAALRRPYAGSRLTPVGSRTTSIANSGVTPGGGHAMATRKRPRSRSSECELAWSWGRLGLFEPSTAAKIGSVPLVARHRSRIVSTDTLIAFAG